MSEELASRSVLGRDVFTRGSKSETLENPAPVAPVSIFKLLDAFQRILARANTILDHQIEFERLSITERINQLVDKLRHAGRVAFDELFEGQRTRAELIVTFLALLEMTRLRLTNIHQEDALAPISIELAVQEINGVTESNSLATDAPDGSPATASDQGLRPSESARTDLSDDEKSELP